MGLDMYLNARRTFWEHNGEQEKKALAVLNSKPIFRLPGAGGNFGGPALAVHGVEVQAMYWRKANHIHAWFVKNVQNGVDDCGNYEVSAEQLTALRDACRDVIADHSKAGKLLPPQGGFFFGSTELDEGYFQDCEETEETLSAILANPEETLWKWSFEYHSSW